MSDQQVTVVVADDSPTLRRIVSGVLSNAGFDVVLAEDGVEALERLAQPDAGVLHALDPATGSTLSRTPVGVTSRFATPALSGRDVIVPTMAGITIARTS